MDISLPYNWRPRPYQEAAWKAREQGAKRFALVWHRRAGKDDFALHSTAVEAHKRVGTYWHMLPKSDQARKAIWEAINPHTGKRRIDEAFPLELRESTRENDMVIKFRNGSTWTVVGSDNYDNLVGSPPIGIVFSEWSLARPEAWNYFRPILAENNGWAMFIYTPRGPNHGLRTYQTAITTPEWFGQLLTVDDTNVFTEEQLALERREMVAEFGVVGEALYEQEYYCSFEAAAVGAIYGDQLRKAREEERITNVVLDPYRPVGTMWDLGYTDATSIWFFQQVGDQIRFVDYYSASNVELAHYAEILRTKREQHGFVYDSNSMFFPHDVEQHELTTGKSRRAVLWDLGIPVITVPKSNIWDGVNLVRREFHRFWFDAERCAKGVESLMQYRREWDEKNRIFSPKPVHDEHSHPADALRTGIAMLPQTAPKTIVESKVPKDRYRTRATVQGPPSQWSA